jgi:hypothetical protein
MPDKAALCRRVAQATAPGGEVWLVDIVIAERAAATFDALGRDQSLFNYVSRAEWQRCFGECGLEEIAYEDLSRPVAEFLRVSDLNVLRDDYFSPRLISAPAAHLELMVQIATQYRRLSRLLRGGMLQYVMMRYRAPA